MSNNQDSIPNCPTCKSEFAYFDGAVFICPECNHEWTEADAHLDIVKVIDANGNELQNGDDVVVIKDLKVKGTNSIKQGTLVKNITLVDEAGHNISCRIQGFGAMNLKSEFVKKV